MGIVILLLLSDLYRNTGRTHAPYQIVMLETTSICNLDCPICPVRRSANTMERDVEQMKYQDVERIVALTRDITEGYCLNMWGEPALHKRFLDIVDHVSQTGRKIWFSTNLNYSERVAERLASNPLLHIVLSVDGWDKQSYAEYRWGGRFDVVRRNMEILGKGRCTVYPQYLVDAKAPDAEERRRHFLDFIQQTLGQTRTIIFKPKIENFRNDLGGWMPGRCSAMYAGLYFNCDGMLVPCCINVGKDLMLRHISSYTTDELRNSPEINSLRQRILTDKNQFKSCQTCAGYDHQTTIQTAIKSHLGRMIGLSSRTEDSVASQV